MDGIRLTKIIESSDSNFEEYHFEVENESASDI